jgi:hypothetical protein
MSGELRQRAEAYLARGSAEPIAWASDELLLAAIDADERIVQVGNCQMVPFAIPLYRDAPDEAATIIRELLASCAELEQAAKSEHRCRMREAELAKLREIGVQTTGDEVAIADVDSLRELSEGDLIMRIVAERIDFMCRLKSFQHYGRGWMRRIADNLRYGASDSGD